MTFGFRELPDGIVLGELSQRVFRALAEHTSFPWAMMQAQCRRVDLDATRLTPDDLDAVIPHLAHAIERFTTPARGEAVAARLRDLASNGSVGRHPRR